MPLMLASNKLKIYTNVYKLDLLVQIINKEVSDLHLSGSSHLFYMKKRIYPLQG